MRPATIVAEMADGSCLVEHVTAFEDFTALVLGYRRDSECVRLTWHPLEGVALIDALAGELRGLADDLRESGCWPVVALAGEVA